MEEHFRNMFDLPLADSPSKKENPFSRKYTAIIEYTINLPPRFDKSNTEIYEKIKTKFLSDKYVIQYCAEHNYYYEQCASKAWHMHGCIYIKQGSFYIEGMIKTLVEALIKAIDGRLRVNWQQNYYAYLQRYRTPMITVQYSEESERILHWEQYIRKNAL